MDGELKTELVFKPTNTHQFWIQLFSILRAVKRECVVVLRIKVSAAILTVLNLLPYQTAIIQLRNLNKDMYKL